MGNGYIIDTLTSVDIQKIIKTGGKLIQVYKGVTYREKFKISTFRKGIEKLVALGQNYKDQRNDAMQVLFKLNMNRL